MASEAQNMFATFTAGEALEPHRWVKLTAANTVSYADAGEGADAIGVTTRVAANGEETTIRLKNSGGTVKVEAGAAIVLNAAVYLLNDGKTDDASSGTAVGKALATAADGDIVEVLLD